MRPVKRGTSPQAVDFDPYDAAQPYLVARLGGYCSYCERRVVTQLAVEHIQPKSLPAYAPLIGRWNNYLLGCVNCNSSKGNKNVNLAKILLPDRDNTFAAFTYRPDGTIVPSPQAEKAGLDAMARDTLALTGLDKKISIALDENGKQVALDRVSQRMQAWALAEETKAEIDVEPGNAALRGMAVKLAKAEGYFSIWLTVFKKDRDMCNRLIDAFEGTRESGCFDPVTAQAIIPAPNPDGLKHGSKI